MKKGVVRAPFSLLYREMRHVDNEYTCNILMMLCFLRYLTFDYNFIFYIYLC